MRFETTASRGEGEALDVSIAVGVMTAVAMVVGYEKKKIWRMRRNIQSGKNSATAKNNDEVI